MRRIDRRLLALALVLSLLLARYPVRALKESLSEASIEHRVVLDEYRRLKGQMESNLEALARYRGVMEELSKVGLLLVEDKISFLQAVQEVASRYKLRNVSVTPSQDRPDLMEVDVTFEGDYYNCLRALGEWTSAKYLFVVKSASLRAMGDASPGYVSCQVRLFSSLRR